MKIEITQEANAAETAGSIVRTEAVAMAALKKLHKVAFCAGNYNNFVEIEGVKNHHSCIPSPTGLPELLGRTVYKLYKYPGFQKSECVENYRTIFFFLIIRSAEHSTPPPMLLT